MLAELYLPFQLLPDPVFAVLPPNFEGADTQATKEALRLEFQLYQKI